MDYNTVTTETASEQVTCRCSKFFNGYDLSNSLNDFGDSVERHESS